MLHTLQGESSSRMSGQVVRYVGAALAGLAALALIAAAVALATRDDDAAPIRIVAPEAEQTAEQAAKIKVQVSGEVASPGVYSMSPDDRVIDAVSAAGGITPNADISGINLSRRVQDEGHYQVPAIGEATPAFPVTVANPAGKSDALIDLNTASAGELETLPGIGPVTADRIIAHREANGPFVTIDDLQNVPDIGPKIVEAIRQLVTVSQRP